MVERDAVDGAPQTLPKTRQGERQVVDMQGPGRVEEGTGERHGEPQPSWGIGHPERTPDEPRRPARRRR